MRDRDLFGNSLAEKKVAVSWIREACQDYTRMTNGGLCGIQRTGRALKPLVDRHGWPAVQRAWNHFLKVTLLQFATPDHFARTFPDWILPEKRETVPIVFREVQRGGRMCLEAEPSDPPPAA